MEKCKLVSSFALSKSYVFLHCFKGFFCLGSESFDNKFEQFVFFYSDLFKLFSNFSYFISYLESELTEANGIIKNEEAENLVYSWSSDSTKNFELRLMKDNQCQYLIIFTIEQFNNLVGVLLNSFSQILSLNFEQEYFFNFCCSQTRAAIENCDSEQSFRKLITSYKEVFNIHYSDCCGLSAVLKNYKNTILILIEMKKIYEPEQEDLLL